MHETTFGSVAVSASGCMQPATFHGYLRCKLGLNMLNLSTLMWKCSIAFDYFIRGMLASMQWLFRVLFPRFVIRLFVFCIFVSYNILLYILNCWITTQRCSQLEPLIF